MTSALLMVNLIEFLSTCEQTLKETLRSQALEIHDLTEC